MEELYASGKVKAIGVSNFSVPYLEELKKTWKVVPAVNQVELHPFLPQLALREYCAKEGIQLEAYSPLGSTSTSSHALCRSDRLTSCRLSATLGPRDRQARREVQCDTSHHPDLVPCQPRSGRPAQICFPKTHRRQLEGGTAGDEGYCASERAGTTGKDQAIYQTRLGFIAWL